MQRNHILPFLAALAVVTASVAAYALTRGAPPVFHGTDLGPGIAAPGFSLEAAERGRVSLGEFRGRAVLLFFGYTQCPDVCPLTMGKLRRALELAGERVARDVQVLLITVDPEQDTPERMGQFLANFDPGFLGLTGTRAELEAVAGSYGAYMGAVQTGTTAPEPDPIDDPHAGHSDHSGHRPPPRLIDHTSQVFGIDRRGNFRLLWGSDATAEQIAEDVARLLRL